MAAVIRAARIDPERMLLPARRDASASHGRPQPVAVDAAKAEIALAVRGSVWSPVADSGQTAEVRESLDREEEARAFRRLLDVERSELLAEARREGLAEGLRQGEAEFGERLDALGALLVSVRGALATEIAGAEDIIVEIAFEAVCKILGEAVARRDGVVAVVRETLRSMREHERLRVRVAPADFALIEQHRLQLLPGRDEGTLDFVADERVVLGGCLVETTGGTLDGRLETQLQRLIETLTSARRMQEDAPR